MAITYDDNTVEPVPITDTEVYTAQTLTSARIVYATAYNYSTSVESITINVVKSSSTLGDTNIYTTRNVAAGQSVVFSELLNHILKTGDSVRVIASAADSVNLSIGIKEVS